MLSGSVSRYYLGLAGSSLVGVGLELPLGDTGSNPLVDLGQDGQLIAGIGTLADAGGKLRQRIVTNAADFGTGIREAPPTLAIPDGVQALMPPVIEALPDFCRQGFWVLDISAPPRVLAHSRVLQSGDVLDEMVGRHLQHAVRECLVLTAREPGVELVLDVDGWRPGGLCLGRSR